MWAYTLRRILYNIPVYLGIVLFVMLALRVNDPTSAYLGKNATPEQIEQLREDFGLNDPLPVQYISVFDIRERSWAYERPVGEILAKAIPPSVSIALPSLIITTLISTCIGLICSYNRGRLIDRTLMVLAVIGMSVSYLVYIILGQYFGAFWLPETTGVAPFAVEGYEPIVSVSDGLSFRPDLWVHYCLLPVLINVIVAVGYDTRFYRAVMVEETARDYITTARAKGATARKIMYVHMLRNAMIPIITRVMITLPFLVIGSILVEVFFNIPGMGRTLIDAVNNKDFPVIQTFTAIFALIFILSNILTDILYALADPRVKLA